MLWMALEDNWKLLLIWWGGGGGLKYGRTGLELLQ
jgi:hypothetical protein